MKTRAESVEGETDLVGICEGWNNCKRDNQSEPYM